MKDDENVFAPQGTSRRAFLALLGAATSGALGSPIGATPLRRTQNPASRTAQPCADFHPEWWQSKAGVTDDVLSPWTPLLVDTSRGRVAVHCALRTYEFGGSSLCEQITAAGRPLLSSPTSLVARIGGTDVAWETATPKVVKQTPGRVAIEHTLRGRGLTVKVSTIVEYDGAVAFSCVIASAQNMTLDELTILVPLQQEPAQFLHFYPEYLWPGTRNSAAVPAADFEGPFVPYVWMGDDARGLAWFAESDEGWTNADAKRVIAISRRAKGVNLRITLIGTPVQITREQGKPARTFAFGLQATPVKPATITVWDHRISHITQTAYGNVRLDIPDEALDRLADAGVRTLVFHEHWTDTHNYYKTTFGPQLKSLVSRCHKRGLQLLLYFGFTISDLTPEWPCIGTDCTVGQKPEGWTPYNVPPQPPQDIYRVCYNSPWQDCLAFGIDRIMQEYDCDGVYLDGTQYVWNCGNAKHGDGYRNSRGEVVDTYPMWAIRSFMKRIYAIVKSHKPNGQVNVHSSGCNVTPTLGWATSYFDGEQLSRFWAQGRFEDALSLDMFRAEFTGRNIGVPAEFLHGGFDFRAALAFTLLHDVPVRSIGINEDLALMAALWRVRDQFGAGQADWLPYFDNEHYVSTTPQGCYVSLHRHRTNGVLAYISNLTRTPANVQATLAPESLGLSGGVTATDAISGSPVEIIGNVVSLPLPPLGWQLVWLRSGKRTVTAGWRQAGQCRLPASLMRCEPS